MAGWLIRKVLQLLIVLCILAAVAVVCILLFVNPTNFRNQINSIIQNRTGYQIEVRGPIEWAFKPQLTLHLTDIILAGPHGFKSAFFTVKDAHIYMDLGSVFGGNLVVNKLDISGMIATLERQADGSRNVDQLAHTKDVSASTLTLNDITIKDSTLLYANEQSQTHWALNNANLSMSTLVLNPFNSFGAIKIKGDFTQLDYNIAANVEATLSYDSVKKAGSLDPLMITWNGAKLQGNTTILQYPQSPIFNGKFTLTTVDLNDILGNINPSITAISSDINTKIQGNFTYSYTTENNALEFPDIEMQVGDGFVKGNSRATFTAPYLMGFDITLQKLNLLNYFNTMYSAIPTMLTMRGINNPVELLKQVTIAGKVAGTELALGPDFVIDQMTADLGVKAGVVQIGPVILKILDGGHNLGLTVDLNQASPVIKLVEQGNNVQLEPWISFFKMTKTVAGIAEVKASLEGNGFTLDSLKQTATGSISLNIKDGTLYGIDLDKLTLYIATSVSDIMNQIGTDKSSDVSKLIKLKSSDWASAQKNNPASKFDNLQIKSDVTAGIGKTNVNLTSAAYSFSGEGSLKLADQSVNMNMLLNTKTTPTTQMPDVENFIKQNSIAVTITGTVNDLKYKPQLDDYISKLVNKSQDTLMNSAVTKMVSSTGASTVSTKRAEQIFVDSLQGLKQ